MRTRFMMLLAILAFFSFNAKRAAAQCSSVPIALDDQVEFFGRAISVEPMLNDREPDGEALGLTILAHNCGGPGNPSSITVLLENGTVQLRPVQIDSVASCTIDYQIEDQTGFTATARIHVAQPAAFLFADGFETGNIGRWH